MRRLIEWMNSFAGYLSLMVGVLNYVLAVSFEIGDPQRLDCFHRGHTCSLFFVMLLVVSVRGESR